MARYHLIIAYDGTHFQGFQRQGSSRTVQGEIECAFRRLGWQGKSLLAAGRTDTGVHASGQVVAFDLDWAHSPEELGQAMNANLPADVAVKTVSITRPDFHPRFDATGRRYIYRLYFAPVRDPLLEPFAWRVWPQADLDLLRKASRILAGRHDFQAFGSPPRPEGTTERVVDWAAWEVLVETVQFEIKANAFLYHMIRRLVFVQVLVGQNRLSLDEMVKGVQAAQSQPPGLAPAHGLILAEVYYQPSGSENYVER